MRGLAYEDLADVSVRRSISSLEQAQVNVSISKLAALADALDFDFVTLVAICKALQEDEAPEKILERASSALSAFSLQGGMAQLTSQLANGKVIQRSPGKPRNSQNLEAVAQLRDQGFSQSEICRRLSLSKSTVHRYWKLTAKTSE